MRRIPRQLAAGRFITFMENISEYHRIRDNAQEIYSKKTYLRCAALSNEIIHFTSEGFNHLVYKGDRSEREKSVQIMKFKLITLAFEIASISTTYQEYDENIKSIRRKRYKKIFMNLV